MGLIHFLYDEYHHIWSHQRDKLASQDPKWAAIEARRHGDGPGIIILSQKHGLTMDDWKYQSEIEDQYLPHTWVHKLHWWWADHGIEAQYYKLKRFYQRGRRGFSNADWWNLHYYLEKVLPPLLEKLANEHHGVPQDYVEKANGDVDLASIYWRQDLQIAAIKIRAADKAGDACSHDNGKCNPKLFHCVVAEENLKEAINWLGEHWYSLWD